MEEGTKAKKTVFVGGIGDDVDEEAIYEAFMTFGEHRVWSWWFQANAMHFVHAGDILEVQIPPQQTPSQYQQDQRKLPSS